MRLISGLRSLLRNLFDRARVEQSLDEELRACVDMLADEKIKAGMSPAAARRAALIEFGGMEQVKEEVRDVRAGLLLETLWRDVSYGARNLARSPAFTALAVLSLALGIGLNSVIFSAINAVLLRPLPFKDPERIFFIGQSFPEWPGPVPAGISPANFLDWEKQNHVFESMAAVDPFHGSYGRLALVAGDEAKWVRSLRVSGSFFSVLGVQPVLGRTFGPEEDRVGTNVVVLSSRLWRQQFGADPNVLGRDVRLGDALYRVIGVMPGGFRYLYLAGPDEVDLWLPNPYADNLPTNRQLYGLRPIARLKQGVSLDQARAEMAVIAKSLEQEYPEENKGCALTASPLHETIAGPARPELLLLLGAVGLVLLIACANVANLLMARNVTRKREIGIRTAIGAARSRIIRQLFTESALLASAGGALGIALALAAGRLLNEAISGKPFRLDEAGIDLRVLGFTLALSVTTALLFGIAPAFHASKVRLNEALSAATRSVSQDRAGSRLRGGLVVVQVALSLVLLMGAGLMINSLWRLYALRLGFNPEHLLTFRCILPKSPRYVVGTGFEPIRLGSISMARSWALKPETIQFVDRVVERLEKLPGVELAAGSVCGLPLARTLGRRFKIAGQPALTPEQMQRMNATGFAVSQEYFRTMQMRILQGRGFTDRDVQSAPPVAVINERMAQSFWPGMANLIGQRILLDGSPVEYEIVGVVDNARLWPKQEPPPQIYVQQAQFWQPTYTDISMSLRLELWFVVRSGPNPAALDAIVGNAIREMDAEVVVDKVQPMAAVVSQAFGPWRSTMLLLGLFAGLAVMLSAIGIYGVISYAVTQRKHEIGIRMALGAGRSEVLRMMMQGALRLTFGGIAIGVAASYWTTRLIASQLFEVAPTDPVTYATVVVALLGVALLACYVPARRAAGFDPAVALRSE